jgi:hypothetical protein
MLLSVLPVWALNEAPQNPAFISTVWSSFDENKKKERS